MCKTSQNRSIVPDSGGGVGGGWWVTVDEAESLFTIITVNSVTTIIMIRALSATQSALQLN